MYINNLKYTFGARSSKFLRYFFTPNGIKVNSDKVKTFLNISSQRTTKEV